MIVTYVLINVVCLLLLATGYASALMGEDEGVILSSVGIGAIFACWLECRRPRSPIQRVGDTVYGVYVPRGNIPKGLERLVGTLAHWQAVWQIDKGPFKGKWAMKNLNGDTKTRCWVPLGDIVIQDRRRPHVGNRT